MTVFSSVCHYKFAVLLVLFLPSTTAHSVYYPDRTILVRFSCSSCSDLYQYHLFPWHYYTEPRTPGLTFITAPYSPPAMDGHGVSPHSGMMIRGWVNAARVARGAVYTDHHTPHTSLPPYPYPFPLPLYVLLVARAGAAAARCAARRTR